MSLSRDIGYTMQAVEERHLITCAASSQGSGAQLYSQSCDASCGINGRVLDRLNADFSSRVYTHVELAGYLYASRGSTEADRKLNLSVKLQHGDSSGGGDMADLSTGAATTSLTFFTSAGTTPMGGWSTGPFYGQTEANYYSLMGAKQYIRGVLFATKNRVTTESSGDEHTHIGVIARFGGADELPQRLNVTGIGSTSTTT